MGVLARKLKTRDSYDFWEMSFISMFRPLKVWTVYTMVANALKHRETPVLSTKGT